MSGCQKPFGKESADMTFLCTVSLQPRSPPPPPLLPSPPASHPLSTLDHAMRACMCSCTADNRLLHPPRVPSPHPPRSVAAVSICLLRDGSPPSPPSPPLPPSYSPSQCERVLKCLPALCNTDTGPQHTDEESGLWADRPGRKATLAISTAATSVLHKRL